jgi:hypothetical protein
MKLAGCYKATVNESETITEAKPVRAFSSEVGTGSVAIKFTQIAWTYLR